MGMKPHHTIAIELINVIKEYVIHHKKPTLVEKFTKGKDEKFVALKNINITISKGEKVGIISPNESGKTTLLKIIAGITTPTKGTVITHDNIVSLIDLEAGFHEDLTGVQNINMNGILLGISKKEVTHKLASIIHFANIKQFIDAPLYTYSQGMKLQPGFAIAVHANPDILVLDENMSVGDTNFQNKSQKKVQEFIKQGKTILTVSHWMDFVKKNCNRILYMHQGHIKTDGNTKAILQYQTSQHV